MRSNLSCRAEALGCVLFTLLSACSRPGELRGLIYVSGSERPTYPSSAGNGENGGAFLQIAEVPSPSAAALSIAIDMSPRSRLRQLNATLLYDDGFDDLLLDADASVIDVVFPPALIDRAKVRVRAVLDDDTLLIVDSNEFVVDGEAPRASIDPIALLVKGSTALPITFRCSEDATGECRFAAAGFPELWGPASAVALPVTDADPATIVCRCSDAVGNVATAESNRFAVDSSPPVISLNAPGTNALLTGEASIEWTASDAHLEDAPITLDYSCDGGATWTQIAASVANTGSFGWQTPAIDVGTCRVRATAVDRVGHTASSSSGDFAIDAAPPVLALTAPVGAELFDGNTATSIAWTASDSHFGTAPIELELSIDSGATWTAIATTANTGSYPWITPNVDVGTARIRVRATDALGNAVSVTSPADFTIDGAPPTVILTSLQSGEWLRGGTTAAITWVATDSHFGAQPIDIDLSQDGGATWVALAGPTANTGSYGWSVPLVDQTQCRVRVTATDTLGNTASAMSAQSFTIDTSTPVVSTMTINGGSGQTTINNNVDVAFAANDLTSNLNRFCLKISNTPPTTMNDPCWRPLPSPGKSVNVTSYIYRVAYTPGPYTVYAWVHDQAGNISINTGPLGKDRQTVNYQPGAPPYFENVSAAGSNAAPEPPAELSSSDLTVPLGQPVYLKWDARHTPPLTGTPVTAYYSTDDVLWTKIPGAFGATGATGVSGASGCTTTAKFPGCAVWTNDVSGGYLKIRLAVTDANLATTYAQAQPLNVFPPVNFLAGNLERGLGASATSSLLTVADNYYGERGARSMVVMPDGVIYLLDTHFGLSRIDPANGILEPLMRITGAVSGNGGDVKSATLGIAGRMVSDYADNILIWDEVDGAPGQIRRLSHSTGIIDRYIGGGVSSADDVGPLNVRLSTLHNGSSNWPFMYVAPNGDVYFESDNYSGGGQAAGGARLRVYRPSTTGLVSSLGPKNTNVGTLGHVGVDYGLCRGYGFALDFNGAPSIPTGFWWPVYCNGMMPYYFDQAALDPLTGDTLTGVAAATLGFDRGGQITALDGRSYTVTSGGSVYRTADGVRVLGTGNIGTCPDGTLATACDVNALDYFVTLSGDVYFIDGSSFGAKIRTVDQTGAVYTVAGQSASFGDGSSALRARFQSPWGVYERNDTHAIAVYDTGNFNVREFVPGGTMSLVAGNGKNAVINTGVPAPSSSMFYVPYYPVYTLMDPANGDLYYAGYDPALNGRVSTWWLDRSAPSGNWQHVGGNAGITGPTGAGDGLPMSNINFSNILLMGLDATGFIGWTQSVYNETAFKHYDFATFTQSHLAGDYAQPQPPNPVKYFCADGTPTATCSVNIPAQSAIYPGQWDQSGNRWLFGGRGRTKIEELVIGANAGTGAILSEPLGGGFAFHDTGSAKFLYYCGTSGRLRKYSFTGPSDVPLPLPTGPTMTCGGTTMVYSTYRNSLVFLFTEDGMPGVAEYLNP